MEAATHGTLGQYPWKPCVALRTPQLGSQPGQTVAGGAGQPIVFMHSFVKWNTDSFPSSPLSQAHCQRSAGI